MKLTPRPPLIALLTDFGTADPYVGIMKGAILSINPDARIVDVSHAVPPQSIMGGGFQLRSSAPHFPDGTLFVAVVDPGVGTKRRIIYAESKRHRFLAPDNGLLTLLAPKDRPRSFRAVTNRRYMGPEISSTFHGRDIFAPVAAWISLGIDPSRLGPVVRSPVKTREAAPRRGQDGVVRGLVVACDQFGNLITNIPASSIRDRKRCVVSMGGLALQGLSATYGNVRKSAPVALIGSTGTVEIGVSGGSAHDHLQEGVGSAVSIHPPGKGTRDASSEDRVDLLEANLDNATGEAIAFAMERLFSCGALDVWTTPLQMKKSRPGVKLSVLAPLGGSRKLADEMLRHTPSFGVRSRQLQRRKLSRRIERVRTRFGSIRVKIGSLDGEAIRAAPEYEDVAAAARRAKVPFDVVHHAASEAGRRLLK